jgi:hypothetical protein
VTAEWIIAGAVAVFAIVVIVRTCDRRHFR